MLDIVVDSRAGSIAQGIDVCRILPFRLAAWLGRLSLWSIAVPLSSIILCNKIWTCYPIRVSAVSYLLDGKVIHCESLVWSR